MYRDDNRDFFLNTYRNIVKTDDGFCLEKDYEELENGKLRFKSKDNPSNKDCRRCLYSMGEDCLMRTKIENLPLNHYVPCHYIGNCDAYSPIFPLNIISSENEIISFIEKTENFFGCVEDYESYFGFERKWDEETGEVLETVREYYNRGGNFAYIPDKFPCVIYFGVVDFDGARNNDEKLDWIYIGDNA